MADIVVNKVDLVIHDRAQGLTGAKGDKGDAGEGIDAGLLAALQGANNPSAGNPFATVDDLPTIDTVIYPVASYSIVAGTLIGDGSLSRLLTANDGQTIEIQEGSGASPMTVSFTFTGVTNFNQITAHLRYAGGSGHEWRWEALRVSDAGWDVLSQGIGNQADFTWFGIPVPIDENYINNGAVTVRWRHISSGVSSHRLYLDYVAVVSSLTAQITPSAMNTTVTPSGNIAATNVQAALEELDAEKISTTGSNRQLTAATGDEVAYTFDYTVNKATSGNDTGLLIKMTDTNSPGVSYPLDIQVDSDRKAYIDNAGAIYSVITSTGGSLYFGTGGTRITRSANNIYFYIGSTIYNNLSLAGVFTRGSFGMGATATAIDVILARDAANQLAQRNETNAQTFNIYNTYTSASVFERGFLKWNANVLEIGTETTGGTARGLSLKSATGVITTEGMKHQARLVENSNTDMLTTDYTLRMSTGNTPRTVNLSAAVVGQIINIKKIDAGTGTVSFISGTSCTIDGSTTRTLSAQYESLTLQCVTAGAECVFDIL